MTIDPELLRRQLEYSFDASERILESLRPIPEQELRQDRGNSHGGLLDTLLHIFYADRVWLSRALSHPRATLSDPGETWTLSELHPAWKQVGSLWLDWAGNVTDAHQFLRYRNLAGQEHQVELWQMVFHVVNHGTYHRGQITTMLRQLGYKPVSTDLHTWYQARSTHASA